MFSVFCRKQVYRVRAFVSTVHGQKVQNCPRFLILLLFRLFHREGNTTARNVYGKLGVHSQQELIAMVDDVTAAEG